MNINRLAEVYVMRKKNAWKYILPLKVKKRCSSKCDLYIIVSVWLCLFLCFSNICALDRKNTTLFAICWLNRSQKNDYNIIIQGFVPNLGTHFFPSTFVIYVSWHNPVWCSSSHIKLACFWRRYNIYVSLQWCVI